MVPLLQCSMLQRGQRWPVPSPSPFVHNFVLPAREVCTFIQSGVCFDINAVRHETRTIRLAVSLSVAGSFIVRNQKEVSILKISIMSALGCPPAKKRKLACKCKAEWSPFYIKPPCSSMEIHVLMQCAYCDSHIILLIAVEGQHEFVKHYIIINIDDDDNKNSTQNYGTSSSGT